MPEALLCGSFLVLLVLATVFGPDTRDWSYRLPALRGRAPRDGRTSIDDSGVPVDVVTRYRVGDPWGHP